MSGVLDAAELAQRIDHARRRYERTERVAAYSAQEHADKAMRLAERGAELRVLCNLFEFVTGEIASTLAVARALRTYVEADA